MAEAARYFERASSNDFNRLDEIIAMQRGVIRSHIHLIASACYPFPSVLRAMSEPGFILPAEGMPGARYLPGSTVMDIVENEGEQLLLELFSIEGGYRASLQPHSGTQANQIAYNAVLEEGDTVLCLKPNDGGHISHTTLIGRRNKTVNYGLTREGLIDYDVLEQLAEKHRPKLIIVGGSALPREIDFERCAKISYKCGAFLHADISHTATFIAAQLHSSVVPHCDFVTFNLVKNLRGPNAGAIIYRDSLYKRVSASIFPSTQGGANETMMLGKYAALLEWSQINIREYAEGIIQRARTLGSTLSSYGFELVTGGTDCHLLLVVLAEDMVTGAEAERRLERIGILANRNLIPGDKRKPLETSGIRFGATNLAILGYSKESTVKLGKIIARAILNGEQDSASVKELLQIHPALIAQ